MEWNNLKPKMLSMFGMGGSMFGVLLPELVKDGRNIMVLSADMSSPAGLDKFKSSFPERFLNLGIAEQNMIGVGAGLSDEGYTVISEAQACFITMRSFEQVRQFCGYMGGKQILIGYGSGFSLTFMGNTHFALEDIALMRLVPGMNVIAPCDALEAMKALDAAVKCDEPTYIRLFGATGTPTVYDNPDFVFEIGKAIKLRDGNDIQIIATGSMVANALKAAVILAEKGIEAEVIDMHTVAPIDTDVIRKDVSKIFSIEEHRATGGLGDAIASFTSGETGFPSLVKIAAPDAFSKVGDYQYLLEENGLSVERIVSKIEANL